MQKKILLTYFLSLQVSNTTKHLFDFRTCTEYSLKLSTNAHSLPRSATKTVILYPLKSYRCRSASLLYAGVEQLKGLKIFERKDPHGYKKALCSTAESKESNMPNLLLTAIEKLLTTF